MLHSADEPSAALANHAHQPSVSVAVSTANRPDALARCLASIELVHDVQQVLVATDGLDRASDDVILAARARDSRIIHVRGPRSGTAANRNACVAWASGDTTLFLAEDALLDADFLGRAVKMISRGSIITVEAAERPEMCRVRSLADVMSAGAWIPALDLNRTLFPTHLLRAHRFQDGRARSRRRQEPPVEAVEAAATRCAETVSVVVPSYRRPDELRRCLSSVGRLDRRPDEVIVVVRADDPPSRGVAAEFADQVVLVERPGQIEAVRAGVMRSHGNVVVLIDDDTEVRHDWLDRLTSWFSDPGVVAVGGRDVVHHPYGIEADWHGAVGKLHWSGKLTGKHHVGVGRARDADFVKGANMAIRRGAVVFPLGLRGAGAQVGNDLAMGLSASARGRCLYEPRALLDHTPATRHDADGRRDPRDTTPRRAAWDTAYNQALVVGTLRPALRWRRTAYAVLLGDRSSVGLARAAVALARHERGLARLLLTCAHASLMGAWHSRLGKLVLDPLDGRAARL
jgi:glycosyltransferase involved in cell wall biosynthesis